MSYLAQLAAAKLPLIAGGGILGVSIVGSVVGAVGLSLTVGGEVISAALGMIAAVAATARR